MIDSKKVGVGIVTFNRPNLLKKCCDSMAGNPAIDHGVIVNDGWPMDSFKPTPDIEFDEKIWEWEENKENIGVGRSKNVALRHLLNQGCDHIFLVEDDIFIRLPEVFEKYVEASNVTGIQHFNYSQHGVMNKTYGWGPDTPVANPRIIVDFGAVQIPLYPHCVGAFSYYSRKCLEEVGLIDEAYVNACEHVDHTYEIIKAGMHPPFWYFADIEHSDSYLGDEPWSIEKSTISSKPNHKQMMVDADKIFVRKHGLLPGQIPLVSEGEVFGNLRKIRAEYGPQ